MNRYPPDAYRQLFLQGKGNRGGPLRPGENGDHYRTAPHFFEWWYFDVAFPDGGWLVAVLNSAAHHVGDHRPNVDLRYYPPGDSPAVATGRFSRQAYEADHTRFRIRVGESWVTEEDGGYHLQLCQGPLVADLIFYSQLPGWRVGTGHLFADPPSGRYFDWVIPVPRARVEGTLTVRGKSRKVAGVGYHDHNWGNVYLPTAFRGWLWGRMWGGEWTLLFGDLAAPGDAPRVKVLLLGRDGRVWDVLDRFCLREEVTARVAHAGSRHLILETTGSCGVSLSLTLSRTMEALHLPALRSWLLPYRRLAEPIFHLTQPVPVLGWVMGALMGMGTYHRWSVLGVLRVADREIEMHGMVERMGLEPTLKGRISEGSLVL